MNTNETTADDSQEIVVQGKQQFACSVSQSEAEAADRDANIKSAAASAAVLAAPSVQQASAKAPLMLAAGTDLKFVMTDLVTSHSRKCDSGEKVRLKLAEPVKVNGVVVIPEGTPATGEIITVDHRGGDGKRGYISGHLVSMTVNGQEVPVSGTFDTHGSSGKLAALAVSTLIPFGNFLVKGTSAKIPAGTVIDGKLLVTVDFTPAKPLVAPIRIPLAIADLPSPRN